MMTSNRLQAEGDSSGSRSSSAGKAKRNGDMTKEAQAVVLVSIGRNTHRHDVSESTEGMQMNSEARWDDVVKRTEGMTYSEGQLENKNDVMSRWRRAVQAASRLQAGDGLYEHHPSLPEQGADGPVELDAKTKRHRRAAFWGSLSMGVGKRRDETEELPYQSKNLEQQHWLEMIDGKHRYGSNMKYYFRKWKEADTDDNFFRWLDRGGGKDLDLEELPRERLERERIQYLSAEQRLNYLVKVDKDGHLRWVRNDEYVDTAADKWEDSGDGGGIIPKDAARKSANETGEAGSMSSQDEISDSYSATSDMQENEATHYVGLDEGEKKEKGWWARKKETITPNGIRKQILRKTLRRNTWLYVSDMKMNLFVGIKKSGTFQHSSILGGGRVTSAGLIVVKRGLIKSLNPHSGHYRSAIGHYRTFIAQLEAKGADLSHVKLAKSVLLLWGLSKYAAVTKGGKDLNARFRKALHISHDPTEYERSEQLKRNAEREEEEHHDRMGKVRRAEEEQQGEKAKLFCARREVLYGRKR